MNTPITWHLDPTVWQRAIHDGYEAEMWQEEDRVEWRLYAIGGTDKIEQGSGRDEADAKAQAEAALREAASYDG